MIYGEDPRQGYVRGRTFVHPGLRFAFDVPPGYRIVNTPAAVIGQGQNGLMKFDAARAPGTATSPPTWPATGPRSSAPDASATSRDRRWTACPWRPRWPRVSSTTAAR